MLELKNISKNLGAFSLTNINLTVNENEYFVVLGMSGAGKSVLLEMVAGLLTPDSGSIILDGKDITNESIQKRNVGIVFQDFAVFPHMTVIQNLMYPLKNIGIKKHEAIRIAKHYADIMNVAHLLNRMPATLSGGEQQRVALARTIAMKPEFLLLDEPLASVDTQLKDELRALLRKINRMGITVIHVTHDYEEALSLAEHIAVIYNGELIQTGTAKEVFQNPKSKFIAGFTGIKNFYNAEYVGDNFSLAEGKIKIHHYKDNDEKRGYLLFRSEDVFVSEKLNDSSTLNNYEGKVIDIFPSIHGIEILVDIGIKVSAHITDISLKKLNIEIGKIVWVSFKSTAVRFLGHE